MDLQNFQAVFIFFNHHYKERISMTKIIALYAYVVYYVFTSNNDSCIYFVDVKLFPKLM